MRCGHPRRVLRHLRSIVRYGPPARFLVCLLLVPCCAALSGQEGSAASTSDPSQYTLHVYEDLVQVAALVTDRSQHSLPHLEPKDLSVRLDDGPPFHPRHMRVEGDDSINLGVLLDDTGGELSRRWSKPGQAPDWMTNGLGPEDRVSVFAFNCKVMAARRNGALRPFQVPEAMQSVLASAATRNKEQQAGAPPCKKSIGLWDAIGAAASQMRALPGRRVLIALTHGTDEGSATAWSTLREYLSAYSIALFGYKLPDSEEEFASLRQRSFDAEDPFRTLCELSGGLVTAVPWRLPDVQLVRTMDLVRSRYIVEFPRPNNGAGGIHRIDIVTTKKHALVHATGVTMPVKDQKQMSDPNTVPNDPNRAPVLGTRKVLSPH